MLSKRNKIGLIGLIVMGIALIGFAKFYHTYHGDGDDYAAQSISDFYMTRPEKDMPFGKDTLNSEAHQGRGRHTERNPLGEAADKEDTQRAAEGHQGEYTSEGESDTKGEQDETSEPSRGQRDVSDHGPEEFIDIMRDETARQEWIEAKLEQYRDDIDDDDMEDFKNIIGKLDMTYAIDILDNPDTEKGEEELKEYLRLMLRPKEYNRARELFFRYDFILLEG